MRSFLVSLAALGVTLPVASDVMPHCGGPTVVIQGPGKECGAHGPSWRGECREPAVCMRLDGSGRRCTIPCATDADCAKLGAGLTCSDQGIPTNESTLTRQPVCAMPR
jgi:hypothetical protein